MTDQPLRVGITCYPTFGGSGIIATEIGLSLARRGHSVHFICYELPSRLEQFQENVFFHEVEVLEYPLFDHSHYALALASKMVEVCTYEKLDLLHVHYAIPHATSGFLAKQIIGNRSPRLLTTLHGTDITVVGSDRSFLPITRFSIVQSDGITVPSRYLKQATYDNLDVPRSVPIEVIPNFVDSERFKPVAQRRWEHLRPLFGAARSWPPGGERPPVLIHNSNFRPLKRVEDVIEVFAQVHTSLPCLLVLIGDGPERSRIERLVRQLHLEGSVCFLGKQLNFVEVLQNSDVFLLPSQTESFGLAALEALSCGVPVVASRVGGLPEVVVDGETGFLHEVGDLAAMAQSALRLLRDRTLHERMSAAARAMVEQNWKLEPTVRRYEDTYRRLLAPATVGTKG
jgi:N-acetyl-alpha-D-glucosaminyl L-malate synthase BshA